MMSQAQHQSNHVLMLDILFRIVVGFIYTHTERECGRDRERQEELAMLKTKSKRGAHPASGNKTRHKRQEEYGLMGPWKLVTAKVRFPTPIVIMLSNSRLETKASLPSVNIIPVSETFRRQI